MTVHQNSIQYYRELINSGQLAHQQRKVLQYIMDHPGETRHEISRGINLPLTSISGRVSELKNMNLIHEKGLKNRRTTIYLGRDEKQSEKSIVRHALDRIIKILERFPELKSKLRNYLS